MLLEGRAQAPETSRPKVMPRHCQRGEQRAGVCSPSPAGLEEQGVGGGQEATGQVQGLILRTQTLNPGGELLRIQVWQQSGQKKVSRQDTKNTKHEACH